MNEINIYAPMFYVHGVHAHKTKHKVKLMLKRKYLMLSIKMAISSASKGRRTIFKFTTATHKICKSKIYFIDIEYVLNGHKMY